MAANALMLEEVIPAEGASFLGFSKTLPALPHYVQCTDARAKSSSEPASEVTREVRAYVLLQHQLRLDPGSKLLLQ